MSTLALSTKKMRDLMEPRFCRRVRSYDELLDAHSLHQFLIFNARCVEASPEFASFQRTYVEHWPVLRAAIGAS